MAAALQHGAITRCSARAASPGTRGSEVDPGEARAANRNPGMYDSEAESGGHTPWLRTWLYLFASRHALLPSVDDASITGRGFQADPVPREDPWLEVGTVDFCKGARQSDLVSVWRHTLVGGGKGFYRSAAAAV